MRVKIGVREFKIPAVALLTLVWAMAKQKEGMPVVVKPTMRYLYQSLKSIFRHTKKMYGLKARQATPILMEANCMAFMLTNAFFIRINEEPQMMPSKMRTIQSLRLIVFVDGIACKCIEYWLKFVALKNIMNLSNVKVIAFDADDTLWDNESYFREVEEKFAALLENFLPSHSTLRELLGVEIQNMPQYGYGIKAFMLSMIETAIKITDSKIPSSAISEIIQLGKEMLDKPVNVLEGVEHVLQTLQGRYRLVVATKGDLLDQERKLKKSNLTQYFHHVEIMTDKKESDYEKLIKHLDIRPEELLMIGNSLKSDVLPVLNLGGYGIHIPYHTTWALEAIDVKIENEKFIHLDTITQLLEYTK